MPIFLQQYEQYFKEIIKYNTRAKCSTKSIQKALELVQSLPQRADEAVFTTNITGYPGDLFKLGRIIRHEPFQVWENEETPRDSHVFLFSRTLMITEEDASTDPPTFKHCATIRVELSWLTLNKLAILKLDKYNVRQHTTDEDSIVFKAMEQGLPSFRIKYTKDLQAGEYVRIAWLKDIIEMQDALCESLVYFTKSAQPDHMHKRRLFLNKMTPRLNSALESYLHAS